jgi:hypothetical protein
MKQQSQRGPIRAAEYVRMPTDHQQYSIANQQDAIRAYAKEHDITIVRTYRDAGKTGLTLNQRPGLRQILPFKWVTRVVEGLYSGGLSAPVYINCRFLPDHAFRQRRTI